MNEETGNLLVAVVPQNITETSGSVDLTLGTQKVSSSVSVQLRNGIINSFTPTSGAPGTLVRLTGNYFSEVPAQNTVTIGGLTAEIIVSSANDITVVVPEDIPAGTYPFTISVLGQPQNVSAATFEGDPLVPGVLPEYPYNVIGKDFFLFQEFRLSILLMHLLFCQIE